MNYISIKLLLKKLIESPLALYMKFKMAANCKWVSFMGILINQDLQHPRYLIYRN